MNEKIAILLITADKNSYVQTKSLLEKCYPENLTLEWIFRHEEALPLMLRNQHDLYLMDYAPSLREQFHPLLLSLEHGCQGPVLLLISEESLTLDNPHLQEQYIPFVSKERLDTVLLKKVIQDAIVINQLRRELQETRTRLLESTDRDRYSLSRRIHEGPLQDLIGMRFYLGIASDIIESDEAKSQLTFVQQSLQSVIDSLRAFCVDLRPPALTPFGLEKAIRAEAGRFHDQHPQVELNLELDHDELRLSDRLRLNLYRIFQHALTNVAQHANATNVRVRFQLKAAEIFLQVSDDGCGFQLPTNWSTWADKGHWGLWEAKERVAALGGHLEVASLPEAGTTITVTVPLESH